MSFKDFITEQTKGVKYLFLDFDGTIRAFVGSHAPADPSLVKVFPWASQRIQEAQAKGYMVVGITNQQYLTQAIGANKVDEVCQETLRQLGVDFPYFFAHTKEESKPSPFMLEQAEEKYGKADKETSLFVGDSLKDDKGAADNFGIRFMTAEEFRIHGIP